MNKIESQQVGGFITVLVKSVATCPYLSTENHFMLKKNMQSSHAVTTAVTNRARLTNEFTDFGNIVTTMLAKLLPSMTISTRTSILIFLWELILLNDRQQITAAN